VIAADLVVMPTRSPGTRANRFEDASGDLESRLRWLVRIGGGSDRDLLSALASPLEVSDQLRGIRPLDVDPVFELLGVAWPEILMGRPCIAVSASEFASGETDPGPWSAGNGMVVPVSRLTSVRLVRSLNSTPLRRSTISPIRRTNPGAGIPGLFIHSSHDEYYRCLKKAPRPGSRAWCRLISDASRPPDPPPPPRDPPLRFEARRIRVAACGRASSTTRLRSRNNRSVQHLDRLGGLFLG